MEDQELDTSVLEAEAAKAAGEDMPAEDSAPSNEEQQEETSKEDSTSADSLKTEEEPKKEEKEQDEEGVLSPFDRHPRFQQLKQQRDEYLNRSKQQEKELSELRSLKEKMKDMSIDELEGLRNAANLLRKNPELAEKVRKVINEHPYEKEEINLALKTIENRQEELETKLILKEYDETVGKLLTTHKIDKDDESMIKEILDNRVVNQRIDMKNVPKALEQVVKDVEKFRRKTIASHIETRKNETKVPVSPAQKGKMIATKKESAEKEDIIEELATGLKDAHANFQEET